MPAKGSKNSVGKRREMPVVNMCVHIHTRTRCEEYKTQREKVRKHDVLGDCEWVLEEKRQQMQS